MVKYFFPLMMLLITKPVFAIYQSSPSIKKTLVVKSLEEFRDLPVKVKKDRVKEVKKEIKKHKEKQEIDDTTLLHAILAIILPPLAVYLHEEEINTKFWISLILSMIFWVPGIVYAMLVVLDQI